MAALPVVQGKQVTWLELCKRVLGPSASNVKTQPAGSLWGGYGSVTRISVDVDGTTHKLVAKQVDPPAGSGVSHERKIKSYAVEAAFYQHYCPQLISAGICAVSKPLLIDVSPPRHFLFLLTDLTQGFPQHCGEYTQQDTKAALDWLAAFHAFWWEQVPGQDNPVTHAAAVPGTAAGAADEVATGLWDQGCYWHLDTRQEEFHSMSGSWHELKAVASEVDEVVKGMRADGSQTTAHRTLIHGDFKAENVLFDSRMQRCAAYDFQYTGEGLGVRDVAYMFASSVDDSNLLGSKVADCDLLQYYHDKLLQELKRHGKATAADNYSFEVMFAQYELCLVDYLRFMAGWGMWGNVRYVRERCKHILPRLQEVIQVARSGW